MGIHSLVNILIIKNRSFHIIHDNKICRREEKFECIEEFLSSPLAKYDLILIDYEFFMVGTKPDLTRIFNFNQQVKIFVMIDDEEFDLNLIKLNGFDYSLLHKKHYFKDSESVFDKIEFIVNYIRSSRENKDEDNFFPESFNSLSFREKEILLMINTGLSTEEIASKLYISIQTVQTHRKNIKNKLKINPRKRLINFIIEHKSQIDKLKKEFEEDNHTALK